MGWLDKYKADLATILNTSNATKSKSAFNIAALVANAPKIQTGISESDWNNLNAFQKVLYADNTSKVLDVLARGNYTTASMADEILRQSRAAQNAGSPINFWQLDKGKVFGAGIEGLEGQSKKTFKDVNNTWENSLSPANKEHLDNTPGGEWGKGVSSFLQDVIFDPTTYMGVGLVKEGITGLKKVVELPKAVKNIVTPVTKARLELETAGKTTVDSTTANKLASTPSPAIAPTKVIAETVDIPDIPLPKNKPQWLEDLIVTGTEPTTGAVRSALQGQRDALRTLLTQVQGRPYAVVSATDIPSIFKESTITRPTVKAIESTVTTPGRAIEESASFNAVKRLVRQSPEVFGLVSREGKLFTKAGRELLPANLNNFVSKIITSIDLNAHHIQLSGRSSKKKTITAAEYSAALSTGKVPEALKNLLISKNTSFVPFGEYVATKFGKYSEASKPGSKVITKLEAGTETIPGEISRSTPKEIDAWKKSLEGVLDPEDIKFLQGSRTKKTFESRLSAVLNKTGSVKFDSLDALSDAAKAGTVTPEELTRILNLHNGAKSLSGAKKYVADLDRRIASLGTLPKPAAELVNDAAVGITAGIDFTPVHLTVSEKEVVSKVVSSVIDKEFINPQTWKFKTTKGTLRTSKTAGEGLGRNLKGFNKFSQYTLHAEIMRHLATEAKSLGNISREQRMAFMYDNYMRLLKASEDTLISRGVSPIVGKGDRGLPLSLHDVLDALPRTLVEHRLLDRLRHIPPTNILDAAGTVAYNIAKGNPIDDSVRRIVETAIMQDVPGNTFKSSVEKGISIGGAKAIYSRSDLSRVVDKFIAAGPKLAQSVERNSARASIAYGKYVEALRKETIDKLVQDAATYVGDNNKILEIVDNVDSYVENAVRAVDTPVLNGATEQVKSEALAALNTVVDVPEVKTAIKEAEGFANKGIDPGVSRLTNAVKTVEELQLPLEYTANFYDKLELAQGVALLRNIFPHIGNAQLRPILLSHESAAKAVATKYSQQLARIAKAYSKSDISEAWKNVQDGIKSADPATSVGRAQIELGQALSTVFNSNPERGVISLSGLSIAHVNSKLAHFGVPTKYRLSGETYKEALSSYTKWEDVTDPLDLLSRVSSGVRLAQADKLVADSIIREFGAKVASTERNVKLINTDRSTIGGLLNGHYFSKDIANQIRVLDRSLKELAKPPSTSAIWRLYDSAIHSYKAGLTIYVPAHHMRNLFGDIWLSSMDGLFNPSYYKRSAKVLASRKTNYRDFNPDVFNIGPLSGGDTMVTLRYRGKNVSLSADNIYRLAVSKGVLSDYTVIEDIGIGASDSVLNSSVSTAIKRISPFKGAVHSKVTKVSEYREHYARMAHFLYSLEQNKNISGKTLQDAIESAAQTASARVRKWHPDGSDYSSFERDKLRRVILFYSWIRKAIPLVIESAATRPGRFMLYPKAMYNMAESNGIDLHGYADPFPVDQLFPTWMHEQAIGPQMGRSGAYFGMKPGIPGPDVLEQYFSSPLTTVRSVASGVTPALKLPWEIATQHSTRTGAPLGDIPSWIIDQLPYGNRINTVAGSPVGVEAKSNVGYNPQLDFLGGATLGSTGIVGLNWLSGLGITDMSKPSYQKSAQIEAKAKAKK